MLLHVAPLVGDAVGMVEPPQKANFLENVLPLLQRLLSPERHLFDGDHLRCDIVPGVVDGAEAAVADFAEVVKKAVRILALKQLGHIGVLEASRSKNHRHLFQDNMECQAFEKRIDFSNLA